MPEAEVETEPRAAEKPRALQGTALRHICSPQSRKVIGRSNAKRGVFPRECPEVMAFLFPKNLGRSSPCWSHLALFSASAFEGQIETSGQEQYMLQGTEL